MSKEIPIVFTRHAREKMADRGAYEREVVQAIREGRREPAALDRFEYRINLPFGSSWQGKHYEVKQVVAIVAEEGQRLVVITVYAFYFG